MPNIMYGNSLWTAYTDLNNNFVQAASLGRRDLDPGQGGWDLAQAGRDEPHRSDVVAS